MTQKTENGNRIENNTIFVESKIQALYVRVGEIFFYPNIQLDLTYVCIFIVKKC